MNHVYIHVLAVDDIQSIITALRNLKSNSLNILFQHIRRRGRSIAQAVSRWLPTAATRVQTRV
jgi:hypothetical protein